jgi:hypothetical protein
MLYIYRKLEVMENYTCCTKCGTTIKNIILIGGKPYGTECAETVLGIKQLPSWFKGGDWDKAKAEQEKKTETLKVDFQNRREITRKNWADFIRLSKAQLSARRRNNDWEANFISSLKGQCGFYTLTVEGCKFETMEDAEKHWNSAFGTFPYLSKEIKGISALSEKQINLLEKIESK